MNDRVHPWILNPMFLIVQYGDRSIPYKRGVEAHALLAERAALTRSACEMFHPYSHVGRNPSLSLAWICARFRTESLR